MINITIERTKKFKKELDLMTRRGKNPKKLKEVLDLLIENISNELSDQLSLPTKYCLHKLSGKYNESWECHIEPDWLLIFYLDDEKLILERTGTHSDLF